MTTIAYAKISKGFDVYGRDANNGSRIFLGHVREEKEGKWYAVGAQTKHGFESREAATRFLIKLAVIPLK